MQTENKFFSDGVVSFIYSLMVYFSCAYTSPCPFQKEKIIKKIKIRNSLLECTRCLLRKWNLIKLIKIFLAKTQRIIFHSTIICIFLCEHCVFARKKTVIRYAFYYQRFCKFNYFVSCPLALSHSVPQHLS